MERELIERAVIVESLAATDKAAALDEVLDAAIAAKLFAKKARAEVRELLTKRESMGSTGIGNGIAVPHVKLPAAKGPGLVLARSAEGIDWDAVDGRAVHTVFLLSSPPESAAQHLEMLRWVSTLARDADFRRFVQAARNDRELRDLLLEKAPS